MILDHMECQNKCFWRVLSSWWPVLALLKSQNALKKGCFGTKNGSKMCFSKNDPRPFGVHKQVKSAHLEPIASHFGHSKVTKCLENGLFCDQKWVKNASKMCFSKNDPRPFGVHKQVKLAHLEPIASHFGDSKVTKCLDNGLVCDQKWVKNASKMCFSKNDPRPFGVHKQVK